MSPNMTIESILSSKSNGNVDKNSKTASQKMAEESPKKLKASPKSKRQKVPKFLMKPKIVLVNGKPLPVRTIVFKEDGMVPKNLKSDDG